MAEAVFLVDIEAPRSAVIDALTSDVGIVSWWTTDAGVSEDSMTLGFPDAPEPFDIRVDSVADDRVHWTSVGSFPPHWTGTEIIWNFVGDPDDGKCSLFFEHTGFATADPTLGHTAFTWANLMNSLKAYCETGKPGPMFDPEG